MLELYRPTTSDPPTTGVGRYLRWRGRQQFPLLCALIALGIVNALTQAAAPYVLGRAVDDGLAHGVSAALVMWCGVLLGIWLLRAASGALDHQVEVATWVRTALGTIEQLGRKVTGTGDALRREVPTGEVVATVASDAPRIADVYEFLGHFIGNLVAYLAVAVILMRSSVVLGLAVLLGIPLIAGLLAFVVRPLQRRQAAYREQNGKLTTLGSDTVSGLRILRGIGGEEVFTARYRAQSQQVRAAGVRVAGTQSLLDSLQTLVPGLLLAGVVWYGGRLALQGEIAVGELVAFYGYAAYLTMPLGAATQGIAILTRGRIAVARVLRVLNVAPATSDTPAAAGDLPAGADLHDPHSGLTLRAGRTTALVAADPDLAAAVAFRCGRFNDSDPHPSPLLGGVALREVPLAAVRERVVVSEATPTIFSGSLRSELDVRGRADTATLTAALQVADAGDVLESIAGGLDGELTEKGRALSGGQRQRVALARALLTDADVLVLVEPTSAVDAHTEARIAARLRAARAGRTTLIVTASPLVLDQVDEVVLLDERGQVRTSGPHHDLMHEAELAARGDIVGPRAEAAIAYRRVVSRSVADSPAEMPHHPYPDPSRSNTTGHTDNSTVLEGGLR